MGCEVSHCLLYVQSCDASSFVPWSCDASLAQLRIDLGVFLQACEKVFSKYVCVVACQSLSQLASETTHFRTPCTLPSKSTARHIVILEVTPRICANPFSICFFVFSRVCPDGAGVFACSSRQVHAQPVRSMFPLSLFPSFFRSFLLSFFLSFFLLLSLSLFVLRLLITKPKRKK